MLHSAPRPPIVLEGPYVNLELAVLALVLGSLAVTAVCRRLGVSSALVLVLAGLAASLIPGVIEVTFDPQVVLLLVLTPLLYSAALDSSYLGIRANKRPIGLLAVGLVTFTAVVVGVVASWLIPGLPLAAGLVLGAVVAPPDAVSALAVGRRLNLPRRVMTILGGESLINDATALTLFRVFLAVAAGAGVTVWGAAGMFVLAAVGGTAVGLAVGWVVHRIRRRLDDPASRARWGWSSVRRVPAGGERARLRRARGGRRRALPRLPLAGERLRHPAAGAACCGGRATRSWSRWSSP